MFNDIFTLLYNIIRNSPTTIIAPTTPNSSEIMENIKDYKIESISNDKLVLKLKQLDY